MLNKKLKNPSAHTPFCFKQVDNLAKKWLGRSPGNQNNRSEYTIDQLYETVSTDKKMAMHKERQGQAMKLFIIMWLTYGALFGYLTVDEEITHLLVSFVLYLMGLSASIYTYYKYPNYSNRAFDMTMILAHMRIAVTIPYAYYKLDEPQWYI